MPRYLKKIWAGDVYEAKEYNSPRQKGKGCERAVKENISSEKIAEYNFLETRKKCARMINTNFKAGDIFLTLTYRNRVGVEEALRLFRNFIGRLKRLRKRKGYDALKYIYVIETGKKGREHLHMIINAMEFTLKEITELWGQGRVMISKLEPGGDYTGLAYYITKENYKEYGRRWNGSRNLEKPRESVTEVARSRKLRAPKNYRVVEEINYYSEMTGFTRYMKAIRIGGEDYGEGKPYEQYFDGEG